MSTGLVLMYFAVLAAPLLPARDRPQVTSTDELAEHRSACGINGVYMFLRLHGIKVSYEEVEQRLRVKESGHSLFEMRAAARDFGARCRVRKYSSSVRELRDCELPLLVHNTLGLVDDPEGRTGHFYLVTRIGQDRIEYVDTTTTEVSTFSIGYFDDKAQSTRYFLEVDRSRSRSVLWVLACVNLLLFALLCFSRMSAARRRQASKWAPTILLCLIAGSATASTDPQFESRELPGAQDERVGDNGRWRVPESDAVNCLYIFLRYHGVRTSYSDLSAALARASEGQSPALADLKHLAADFGLPVEVMNCPPNETMYANLPAIGLLEGDGSEGMRYAIVFGYGGERGHAYVIDGANVSITRLSIDRFRTSWSGFMLTGRIHRDPTSRYLAGAIAACYLVAAIWRIRRHFVQKQVVCADE